MGYQYSSFNPYGNINVCNAGPAWWPSTNNWGHILRTRISNYYMVWLGRYAESGGLEGYVQGFMAQYNNIASDPWQIPPSSHISDTVYYGGINSGELPLVWANGRHINMRLGYCLPPPVYGCTNSTAANYNPSADTDNGSCWWYNASVSISANPTSIIVGQNTTISWNSSNAQSVSVSGNGLNSTSLNGSQIVSPYSTTTYNITGWAYGNGASGNDSVIITVYVPPVVFLTTNAVNNTIILGQSCTLTWNTTGDADTANLSPILGNVPINSNVSISPTSTTTYTISVSGPGGNDSDQITITVLQPPIVSINSDSSVDYGDSVTITYSGVNCNESLSIVPVYTYLDNTTTTGATIQLTHGDNVSGTYIDSPPYNTIGPKRVLYTLTGNGNTLSDTDSSTTYFEIDQIPNAIVIPESLDNIKDEDPVISPDDTVTSQTLEITDIDIPVEIKSDYPIQVELEDDEIWRDIQEM